MADIKDKWPWPPNVGVLGTFPEEVKALQRSTEKNPDASPMPALGPVRLLSPHRSSDSLRLGDPNPVEDLASDGATITLTHVILRRVLAKGHRRGAVLFDEAVESEPLTDLPDGRREQMKTMIQRERALLAILDRYNGLAEAVYMRLLAGAKG